MPSRSDCVVWKVKSLDAEDVDAVPGALLVVRVVIVSILNGIQSEAWRVGVDLGIAMPIVRTTSADLTGSRAMSSRVKG